MLMVLLDVPHNEFTFDIQDVHHHIKCDDATLWETSDTPYMAKG